MRSIVSAMCSCRKVWWKLVGCVQSSCWEVMAWINHGYDPSWEVSSVSMSLLDCLSTDVIPIFLVYSSGQKRRGMESVFARPTRACNAGLHIMAHNFRSIPTINTTVEHHDEDCICLRYDPSCCHLRDCCVQRPRGGSPSLGPPRRMFVGRL